MNTPKKFLIAAFVMLFACVGGYSQIAPGTARPAANIDLSTLSPELRALIVQLQEQAVELKGLVSAVRGQMKDKTVDERKAIIEQFRHDHAELMAAQRALARQIRVEMRALRRQNTGSG